MTVLGQVDYRKVLEVVDHKRVWVLETYRRFLEEVVHRRASERVDSLRVSEVAVHRMVLGPEACMLA